MSAATPRYTSKYRALRERIGQPLPPPGPSSKAEHIARSLELAKLALDLHVKALERIESAPMEAADYLARAASLFASATSHGCSAVKGDV